MATIATLRHDGRPDWGAIEFDVHCGRCGYNLRMLEQPRCPECGLEYEWAAVLDQSAWRSDFLFEHHWREHPLRSWARTFWCGLRPFRFWRRVSIHDRVEARPLWFLLLTSAPPFTLLSAGVGWLSWAIANWLASAAAYGGLRVPGSQYLYGISYGLSYYQSLNAIDQLASIAYTLSWLLSALAVLCCLRQTLGRCRVRTVQVLRVVAYSAAPVCFGWCVVDVLQVIAAGLGGLQGSVAPHLYAAWMSVVAGPVILTIYLAAGLRVYLRLPRAILLGLAASLIAFLAPITASLVIDVYLAGGWG